MKYHFKKAATALLLTGIMMFQMIPYSVSAATTAEDMEYLNTYFQIGNISQTVPAEEFCADLEKITGVSVSFDTEYTGMVQLLQPILQAAGLEELALTFPEEKSSRILADNQVQISLKGTAAQYAACAISSGLIKGSDVGSTSISKTQAVRILAAVADASGNSRNFLGYSNDPDIYGKINHMWESFEIFSDETLDSIGSQAVQNKTTTGYNLKKESYTANFIPSLTLRYGHSDIKHANQIIGLLQSEGIVAKVQLEPKVSIYEYLLDWGPVPPAEPRYEVKQFSDDLYLVYAVEYDLALEFSSAADKNKFDNLILSYAKKNAGNEEAIGLLYESWWQPLYTSATSMNQGAFRKIVDNVITNGEYSIHSFSTEANAESVKEAFLEIDPSIQLAQKTLWCNDAFFRYLNGEDYQ